MTHDELLKRLWEKRNSLCDHLDVHFTLSAVVELHKPIEGNEHLCSACWFGDGMMAYPCLTLQAIEKELV